MEFFSKYGWPALLAIVAVFFAFTSYYDKELNAAGVQVVTYVFLVLAVGHIIQVRRQTDSYAEQFQKISRSVAEVDHSLGIRSSMMAKIMGGFEIKDRMLGDPLLRGVRDIFEDIIISDHRVEVKGKNISESLYRRFWERLLEIQVSRKSFDLKLYVSHSSTLDVWDHEKALLEKQYKFARNGGKVFRILVRNKGAKDEPEKYQSVVNRMKENGADNISAIFYDNFEGTPEVHDYLIVEIKGRIYVFEWCADWNTESHYFGVIERSIIYSEPDHTEHFLGKWRGLLEAVEDRNAAIQKAQVESTEGGGHSLLPCEEIPENFDDFKIDCSDLWLENGHGVDD